MTLALVADERALLVHFWASWCPECIEDLPELGAAVSRCRAAGVRIVTVNVGEEREAVVDYLARHGLDLPVLRDPSGRAWRHLGRVGLPTNLVETAAGRRVQVGGRSAAAWSEALAELGCPALSP